MRKRDLVKYRITQFFRFLKDHEEGIADTCVIVLSWVFILTSITTLITSFSVFCYIMTSNIALSIIFAVFCTLIIVLSYIFSGKIEE